MQPTKFNMRIDQCTADSNCSPTHEPLSSLYTANYGESVGTTSKFVLYSHISIDLFTNTNCSGTFLMYHTCVQGCSRSRPKHTFKLPHWHVLRPGSLIRNKVQHTAVLCDFTYVPKGLQMTATSFISVFIFGATFLSV